MEPTKECPACPVCKRTMEPFNGFWTCGHGTQFTEIYRPDSTRPGRWRVYRGEVWSLVGGPVRKRNRRAERAARAARENARKAAA